MPLLMRALRENSMALAQDAIMADPTVAQFPFWEHGIEPPLCFAVRHKCKSELIALLLQNGADIDAKNIRRQSPLDILKLVRQEAFAPYEDLTAVEKLFDIPPREVVATNAHEDLLSSWDMNINEPLSIASFSNQGQPMFSLSWVGA